MSIGHILIVEDDPDSADLLCWMLEDAGHTCCKAETAELALQTLRAQSVDLVLMDIELPGMDGVEATQTIRNDPDLRAIPVLAVTAHAVAGERERIARCGVDDLMTKPVDEDLLLAAVRKWLGGRQARPA